MVRERKHQELRCWMEQAIRSGIPELGSFVAGIERDYDAVQGLMADFGESGQESCNCDH
jgi:transposase